MKKDNIVVVFSTHFSEAENQEFIKHIDETIGVKHKVVSYPNYNQYSLPQIYNDAIEKHSEPNCIFVMCHNDIIIKTKNWGKLLLNHFNQSDFTIIGVAGTTFIPQSGMWWEDRSKMYGIVEHTNGVDTWVSQYSNEIRGIQSVVTVDGVFMSFDPQKIAKRFNENFGMFHFYDIPFCVDNYNLGCDVGVITNIRVLHKSIGMTNQSWEENRQKFASTYQLPLRHFSETKLRVLLCCQFFKTYTGSEMSNFELSKALVKAGCDVTIISPVVGEPLKSKAEKAGVKVYNLGNVPNYRYDQNGQLVFVLNEKEFDIIHINHKPIGDAILQLYPNTPAVMHVRSEVIPVFEEPIIHPQVKRYISIRESITEYIKGFGISEDKIELIDNPFDTERFNTKYKQVKNQKPVVLFVGTLDHLREKMLYDLVELTENANQELWIIGADSNDYAKKLTESPHVKYLGVKSNVEDYVKKCDFTAGIFKGRTTIEGFLCGKQGWIYTVDNYGNILGKELKPVPSDIEKYSSKYSAEKVKKLYEDVIDELIQ